MFQSVCHPLGELQSKINATFNKCGLANALHDNAACLLALIFLYQATRVLIVQYNGILIYGQTYVQMRKHFFSCLITALPLLSVSQLQIRNITFSHPHILCCSGFQAAKILPNRPILVIYGVEMVVTWLLAIYLGCLASHLIK